MTAALEGWVSGQQHAPAALYPPGKSRYPFYRRLGGPQGQSGRAANLVPTGIRSRTAQPGTSVAIPTELPGLHTHTHTHTHIYIYIYTYIYIYGAIQRRNQSNRKIYPDLHISQTESWIRVIYWIGGQLLAFLSGFYFMWLSEDFMTVLLRPVKAYNSADLLKLTHLFVAYFSWQLRTGVLVLRIATLL